jgi:hypothetical protein
MSSIRSMRRHGVRTAFALVAAATLIFALLPSARSVHDDGVFELDRNATDAGGTPGADWNNLGGADVTTGIISDGIGPTIFTGGGSKDDLNTTGWKHKNGSVPDKDELLHGFAARYGDAIYFGADRYDNSGDAVMGFWFFQNDIGPVSGGRFGPESHKDGDILILSDFTQGGGVVTIRVFQWNGPGGDINGSGSINGTLDLIAGTLATPADCVGPPSVGNNDNFCATVNALNTPAPWSFQSKDGAANVFPPGHFYEGGIDLAFLGLEDECFSSFLAESRASTSVDSTLKDFVAGDFESCEAGIVTTPTRNGNAVTQIDLGQSIVDVAVVTGTGTSNPPVPTGTVAFAVCGPLAAGVTCTSGGQTLGTKNLSATGQPGEATATSDPFTPLSAGRYCFRGDYSGDANYDAVSDSSEGECFVVNPRQPSIVTNATAAAGVPLGTAISDSATLSNTADDADGSKADGTITFNVYGPDDANCSGAAAFTGTASVQGDGTYSSGNFTPTLPGTYRWVASYSGDLPNTLSVSGACNDANEASLVIQLNPSISTDQWVYPNDEATITVATGGGDLTGSVSFKLFSGATCGGTALYSETVQIPANAGLSETVKTTNTATKVSVDGLYSWEVKFTSTNQGHTNAESTCSTETFQIDFTDDVGS